MCDCKFKPEVKYYMTAESSKQFYDYHQKLAEDAKPSVEEVFKNWKKCLAAKRKPRRMYPNLEKKMNK